MKYLLFKESDLIYYVLDRENKKYIELKNGAYKDLTDTIEKMHKSYYKAIENFKQPSIKMGVLYFDYLIGNADRKQCLIYNDYLLLETDNRQELDLYLLEKQKEQLEIKLLNVNRDIEYIKAGQHLNFDITY